MSTYKVKSTLKHNGQVYEKGTVVDLDGKTAEILLNDGVIVDTNTNDEDEEVTTPQPAVNNVTRENDDVEGDTSVEAGTVETAQPGDNQDDENKDNSKNHDGPDSENTNDEDGKDGDENTAEGNTPDNDNL